jgi:glycerol-3-phosphate O-acyltransferase
LTHDQQTPIDTAFSGRIFSFNQERPDIVASVIQRELEAKAATDARLEYVLNDAAFREIARLEQARSESPELREWRSLYGRVGAMSHDAKRDALERLLRRYSMDVVGSFSPGVYKFVTNMLPKAFEVLLKPQLEGSSDATRLSDRMIIQGEVEHFRALTRKGTVILVPTHQSHLDSVLVGFSLLRCDLPPFTYGAGKNLFTNPFWKFFLPNLGAYKVDRRLTHQIYKDVLKQYSTVLLERGYHSLFFPGGTRARSGEVEHKLKLGLLGTSVTAYANNVLAGHPEKKIFIVPCTVSYNQVLEAETLIDDQLKQLGQSRYIIERDESTQVNRIFRFIRQTLSLDATVYVTFSKPLDPFGNDVDMAGESYDRHGRRIDTERYLWEGGEPKIVPQRDAEYTKECGSRIVEAYMRDNVLLSTNILAFALFQSAKLANPGLDLYHLMRMPDEAGTPLELVAQWVDKLREQLSAMAMAGDLRLGTMVATAPATRIVTRSLDIMGMYHSPPVAERRGDRIHRTDMRLLYFYQNRLANYGLEATMREIWKATT